MKFSQNKIPLPAVAVGEIQYRGGCQQAADSQVLRMLRTMDSLHHLSSPFKQKPNAEVRIKKRKKHRQACKPGFMANSAHEIAHQGTKSSVWISQNIYFYSSQGYAGKDSAAPRGRVDNSIVEWGTQ